MDLFDSHCHIQLENFDDDREDVYQNAREAGVESMTVVGIDTATAREAISFCRDREGCHPTAGLHPHDADRFEEERKDLRALLDREAVVAVGETGLDYVKEWAPKEQQKKSLRRHIDWALELEKPLIFHCRDADDDLVSILRERREDFEQGFSSGPGVVHCFSGTAEHLRAYRDMGFYVSFSGILTFPNAEDLREAARSADPEGVLVETDSPFLAPQKKRGKRNEPAFVRFTLEKLASVLEMDPEELAEITSRNARRLFLSS